MLQDGRVLIVWEDPAAELYDPNAGSFTPAGKPLAQSYTGGLPTATLVMNGKILVAGGATVDLFRTGAELYDSSSGIFTATGNMVTGHLQHTATLLPDGTVLLFAGGPAIAETYASGTLSPVQRNGQTAPLLKNGQVLVTGGILADPYGAVTSDAHIYHPVVLVPAPQLRSLSATGKGRARSFTRGPPESLRPAIPAFRERCWRSTAPA